MGHIGRCTPKSMDFKPFSSQIGFRFWSFWSHKGFVFFTLVLQWVCFLEEASFYHYRQDNHQKPVINYVQDNCVGRNGHTQSTNLVRSKLGRGRQQILVINRVRILGSEWRIPIQFSESNLVKHVAVLTLRLVLCFQLAHHESFFDCD